MSIIRFGENRDHTDGEPSNVYAWHPVGVEGLEIATQGEETELSWSDPDWTGNIHLPPEDVTEFVSRLLARADAVDDADEVATELTEYFEETEAKWKRRREEEFVHPPDEANDG